MIDSIEEWCCGLYRHEHSLVVRKKLPHLQDPNEFLEEHNLEKNSNVGVV